MTKPQDASPERNAALEPLIDAAIAASRRAYTPYSHFQVGAALELGDGTIIPGCNVENASFGLTNCAERTALFSAIAQGRRDFARMVIYVATEGFISPCGACRQVLFELAPDMPIVLVNKNRLRKEALVRDFLPLAFGAHDLRNTEG